MRDNATNDTVTADEDHDLSNGFSTHAPMIVWDRVPGASSYELQLAPYSGSACLLGRRRRT